MNLTEAYQRRLLSFHVQTEDFFNPNHSKSDGRFVGKAGGSAPQKQAPAKGKMWSGISADPDNRTKPRANLGLPFAGMSEAKLNHIAKRIYEADLGDGFHSKVVEGGEGDGGTLYVRGYIMKGKDQVGAFERTLSNEGKDIVVNHDEFIINGSKQGKGLGDRFNAHASAVYQEIGVDRVTLEAGLEVGGYAWARQGFRFHGSSEARKQFLNYALDKADGRIKHIPALKEHRVELEAQSKALRKAIEAGKDVQPIHIASLGEKYKYTTHDDNGNQITNWAGKDALLGTSWKGVYYFDAAAPVTASASSIEHAKLRPAFLNDTVVKLRAGDVEEFFNKNHSKVDGRFASGQSIAPGATGQFLLHAEATKVVAHRARADADGVRYRASGAQDHEWVGSYHGAEDHIDREELGDHYMDFDRSTTHLTNGLEVRILIPSDITLDQKYTTKLKNEIADGLEIAQAAYPPGAYTQNHITVRLQQWGPSLRPEEREDSLGVVDLRHPGYKPNEIGVFSPAIAIPRPSASEAQEEGWGPAASKVSTLTYTIVHESGHILEANRFGVVVSEAPPLAGKLSEYAKANSAEAYAEAFADFAISKGKSKNEFTVDMATTHGWVKPEKSKRES